MIFHSLIDYNIPLGIMKRNILNIFFNSLKITIKCFKYFKNLTFSYISEISKFLEMFVFGLI